MKEILKEWKKWLIETAPTEKDLGQPKYKRNNPHDRATPDTLRQGDMRSTFKAVLKNFMYSSKAFGQVEALVSKLSDDEKAKVMKDLSVMKYIYMGRTPYSISDTDIKTRSPHESSNQGILPAPNLMFQVITFRLSIV